MKQLLVIMAVLPLLLIFLLQAVYDQKTAGDISTIQALVYATKEEARQEGIFSQALQERLKNDLSESLNIDEDEIIIECDDVIKYRYSPGAGRNIYYKISVPVKDVMAGGGMLGIGDEENSFVYTIDSYTASEKL